MYYTWMHCLMFTCRTQTHETAWMPDKNICGNVLFLWMYLNHVSPALLIQGILNKLSLTFLIVKQTALQDKLLHI